MSGMDEPAASPSLLRAAALARLAWWECCPASGEGQASPGLLLRLGEAPGVADSRSIATGAPLSREQFAARIHPDDLLAWQAWLHRQSAGEAASGHFPRIRLRHLPGGWRWFGATAERQAGGSVQAPSLLVLFEERSEQQELEAALRDSQMRYRSLYETAPVAIVLTGRNGTITEWNRQAAALFGWSRQEVLGHSILELLLPAAQRTGFAAELKSGLQRDGRTGSLLQECVGRDGGRLFCQWQSVRLNSSKGAAHGLLTLIQDVSESYEAQQALQRNEMRYRTLVETTPDAILVVDPAGRIEIANQEAARLCASDGVAELYEQNAAALFLEPVWQSFVSEVLDDPDNFAGFVAHREFSLTRRDGEALVLEIFHTALAGQQAGEATTVVFFLRDVTAARRAENDLLTHRNYLETLVGERTKALEQQKDRLQSEVVVRERAEQGQVNANRILAQIIDGSPIPTFVIDATHTVTHWNHACEVVLGIAAEEIVGTRTPWKAFYRTARPVMADLLLMSDDEAMMRYYGDSVRPSMLVQGAYEAESYFPKTGRWLSFLASPLTDSGGRVIGAIETLQDITERKRAELSLVEAKNLAESAAHAKGSFLANMSHEIRTPMNAILGLARLLMKTARDDQQRDYLQRIVDAGGLLLRLLNDVLDLSKIEAGRMTIEKIAFCLDEVLENATSIVLQRVQEKGLELHISVAPDVPGDLLGDPLRLSQILVNLLSNAAKFTESGFIAVFVRSERRSADTLSLHVDVQDTGIGLSAEQASRLFAAFSQAEDSTTRRYGGTGLGLSICKKLAEAMDGTITVSSQPGQGCTFSFEVMLGFSDAPPQGNAAVLPAALSGARALVVDDQPLACRVLAELLRPLGLQVDVASRGDEALNMLRTAEPAYALLFTDWRMPDMDGALLQRLVRRQLAPERQPLSILVSAHDATEVLENPLQVPFDGVLHKPVVRPRLLRLLTGLGGCRAVTCGAPESAPRFSGQRVLLADDVPTNRLIAVEALEEIGLSVEVAADGHEVLELLATSAERGIRYEALLLDVQMPRMDGLEATRHLRADPDFKRLPVIALTAQTGWEEQDRCLLAGMSDFLSKPFTVDALRRTLLRWLPGPFPVAPAAPVCAESAPIPLSSLRPLIPPPPPAPSCAMPSLPGIDTAVGLPFMNNRVAFYEKMLRQFGSRFAGHAESIRASLAGEPGDAARMVHSLKGVSGAIGAVRLQLAAGHLDEALRDGIPDLETELREFEAALSEVVDGIQAHYGT